MGRPLILFSIGGVGLGNSTRCHAIIQRLEGARVEIMGFGNAVSYFSGNGWKVRRLFPLRLARSFVGELFWLPANLVAWLANVVISAYAIFRLRPDVVVVDSEYSAILPALLAGRRLVGINHAGAVVAQWRRYARRDLYPSFYGRELIDAWISRLFHRTIVPVFRSGLRLGPRDLAVAPIVRVLPPRPRVRTGLLVLRGGSSLAAPLTLPTDAAADEIGGARQVDDALERIAAADVVVCQGGISSLSEVLALGAKAIVVPLPSHAEQSVNSRELAGRGAVVLAEDGDVGAALERTRDFVPDLEGLRFDGALAAARELSLIASGAAPAG